MSFLVSCSICGSSFKSESIVSSICPDCSQKSSSTPISTNNTKRSKDQIQTDIKRIQQQAWENYKKSK